MFLIVRIPPELAMIIIIIALIGSICTFIKNLLFLNKDKVDTTEANIIKCESTRYYHIYYINTFTYSYVVGGTAYKKEDKETIVFKKNREDYPTVDTVEYLKSKPSCSRLNLINRKGELFKNIFGILFVIAAGVLLYIFYLM